MSIDTVFENIKEYKDISVKAIVMIREALGSDFLLCNTYTLQSLFTNPQSLFTNLCNNSKFIITYKLTIICLKCSNEIDLFNYSLNRIYVCNKVSWITV